MIEIDKSKIAGSLGKSRFLRELALYYALAPSAVLIRTAEAELFSALPAEPPILDLCCGDGFFSSLICPGGVEVGCDLSLLALQKAHNRGQYRQVVCADVTKRIPFQDKGFQTVMSNSSLEHVSDIDASLREIRRVLKPGGRLIFTLASNYAYEWWPCGQKALQNYLRFQPVYNYFCMEEWEQRLTQVGLHAVKHQYYLSKRATQFLLWLDYHFSHVYLTSDKTRARFFIGKMRAVPKSVLAQIWRRLFSRIRIYSDGTGGGILIVAERT